MGLTAKPLTDIVTFTRASTATYFGSDGLLKTAAVDEPRIEYDPATGEVLGLLIEEQRTNSLLHNRDLSQAAWTKTNATQVKDAIGIDGAANSAHTLTDTAGGGFLAQNIAVANNSNTATGSFFIAKDSDQTRFLLLDCRFTGGSLVVTGIRFNTATGDWVLRAGIAANVEVEDKGGFWRVSLKVTNNSSGNTTYQYLMYPGWSDDINSDGNKVPGATFVYDLGQVEFGSDFATSPILTGASGVTRSPESPTADLGSFYNRAEGAIVCRFKLFRPTAGDSATTWSIYSNAQNRIVYLPDAALSPAANTGVFLITDQSLGQSAIGTPLADQDEHIVAVKWAEDDVSLAQDGVIIGTDPAAIIPQDVNLLSIGWIGYSAASYINGHIKSLSYYPRALSDERLQELSTL